MNTRDGILALQKRMNAAVIGQERMVERLLLGLVADGNLLVEGLPGLAKTRAIKSLAANLEAGFSRIQFTPDLLPADVTGSDIYFSDGKDSEFRFQQGPIFSNLVLADEINRAPAKVQSALLEAMEERQVTVGGKTHPLPALFLVMATQNPIEQEGTYPLPEAQLDRFLMQVEVGYGDEAAEAAIMRLVRSEENAHVDGSVDMPKLPADIALKARTEIAAVTVSKPVEDYIVALVFGTRYPHKLDDELAKWIEVGVSPRGAIGLDKVARCLAWLRSRDFVTPDDVKEVVHDVFRHRLILAYEAHAAGISSDQVIDRLLQRVAVA
ncbi:ATPase AAA [Aureimonas altamirensis]|uniref:ATPase AAA n=1 Tax=Aureimonas altamirensis TaxID=370622 RepID=A0A0B1Q2E0_9HYPH|nr:AAA family ATPase [Aureimonas altamirensis]KHJ54529.1 ATPase AAA [Aureimonas altamirensis]